MICRVQPESSCRDLSCFGRAYGKMTETCYRMYFGTIRESAPLTFSAMFSGTFAITLYGRISIFWQFSDIAFVVF